jgi:integrase
VRFVGVRFLRWLGQILVWSGEQLRVRAFNTKTARSRTVALTLRAYTELLHVWEASARNECGLVFGGIKSVRASFTKACKAAHIIDFHFHDCRHTAITRLIRAGLPPVEVMRVSGHTTLSCLYRYSNLDSDTVFRAAAALDAYHAQSADIPATTTELIQ